MKHSETAGLSIPPDTRDRLLAFEALLRRWNAKINLVSRAGAADLWQRHIIDSVQLGTLLPPPGMADPGLTDLGSGAGFPGLVLAITTGRHVALVESDQRKAAFLREAIRTTGANATVHASRIETLDLPPAAAVTARALAPLPHLLSLAYPKLAPGGSCLFPKGETVNDELTAAANGWQMRVERFASLTHPGATILRLSEISRVGPET